MYSRASQREGERLGFVGEIRASRYAYRGMKLGLERKLPEKFEEEGGDARRNSDLWFSEKLSGGVFAMVPARGAGW